MMPRGFGLQPGKVPWRDLTRFHHSEGYLAVDTEARCIMMYFIVIMMVSYSPLSGYLRGLRGRKLCRIGRYRIHRPSKCITMSSISHLDT